MKKQNDFIKNKLASLDAVNADAEFESAPESLRQKYPALSARFSEKAAEERAESTQKPTRAKQSRKSSAIFACCAGSIAACAVVAAIVIPSLLSDDDGKDCSHAPPRPQLHYAELTLDALAQNYDVLVPPARDGFTCVEYKYNSTQKTAYLSYVVENFTIDIVIDPYYEYETHIFDKATVEQSAPLFDYRYAELGSNTIATWQHSNYTYYATMTNATQEQLHATLCALESV